MSMEITKKTLLIGDIGGTNARFALANPEYTSFNKVLNLKCADFLSADDAIQYYLDKFSTRSNLYQTLDHHQNHKEDVLLQHDHHY